jgi:hypothetical protein
MENYIMTFEDGTNYVAHEITAEDIEAVESGYLNIIRCSDMKELFPNNVWEDLKEWIS